MRWRAVLSFAFIYRVFAKKDFIAREEQKTEEEAEAPSVVWSD